MKYYEQPDREKQTNIIYQMKEGYRKFLSENYQH